MRLIKSFFSGLVFVAFLGSAVLVVAQSDTDSILEHYGALFSGADEFFFFEAERKQAVDYQQERIVRICAGDSRHQVPLRVTADGRAITLGSGDCIRVEAKQVYLEPDSRLDANTMLIARVETLTAG